MLWERYVFRRGEGLFELWSPLFERRRISLLYIAGNGFDVRAQVVMREFLRNLKDSNSSIESANLLLVGFADYELDESLRELTIENAQELESMFGEIGSTRHLTVSSAVDGPEELTASQALRRGIDSVLMQVEGQTDIVLDVSSLPRVVYLSLLTSLLNRLIPNKDSSDALVAGKTNFQIVVAEDPELDAQIRADDPSNDPVLIPGFSSALQAESVQEWPLVWFPILGENRLSQFQQIIRSNVIPESAEICPILPHPARNPRRADRLLVEYKEPLFDSRETPTSNIMYVHESHPFEAYRQLLQAMLRYRMSMEILGGCRLVVTPLGSKLITIGAGLACFEMRSDDPNAKYRIAIPHVEPTRYFANASALRNSRPEISALLLTGDAYL